MKGILEGVARFQSEIFPQQRVLFQQLATGQQPKALFLICSDSRVDPNLITQTLPGELFICRNAGNIVPPHSDVTGGVTASVEYAVAVLEVPNIIVCGHTHCGAMHGVMNPRTTKDLPHVTAWLNHSQAALQVVNATQPDLSGEERLRALIEQNTLAQIQNLKTHPHVAAKLAAGHIHLHAWVYEIESGKVLAYEESLGRFVPLIGTEPSAQPKNSAEAPDES